MGLCDMMRALGVTGWSIELTMSRQRIRELLDLVQFFSADFVLSQTLENHGHPGTLD